MLNYKKYIANFAKDMGSEYGPCKYVVDTDEAIKACHLLAEEIKQDFITAGQRGLISTSIVEHIITHINDKYLNQTTEIV